MYDKRNLFGVLQLFVQLLDAKRLFWRPSPRHDLNLLTAAQFVRHGLDLRDKRRVLVLQSRNPLTKIGPILLPNGDLLTMAIQTMMVLIQFAIELFVLGRKVSALGN